MSDALSCPSAASGLAGGARTRTSTLLDSLCSHAITKSLLFIIHTGETCEALPTSPPRTRARTCTQLCSSPPKLFFQRPQEACEMEQKMQFLAPSNIGRHARASFKTSFLANCTNDFRSSFGFNLTPRRFSYCQRAVATTTTTTAAAAAAATAPAEPPSMDRYRRSGGVITESGRRRLKATHRCVENESAPTRTMVMESSVNLSEKDALM